MKTMLMAGLMLMGGSGVGFLGGANEDFVKPEDCTPIVEEAQDGSGYFEHEGHVGQGLHLQDGSCIEFDTDAE